MSLFFMKGFSFDELHIMSAEIYQRYMTADMTQYQKGKAVEGIFDELLDLLIYYYLLAEQAVIDDLGLNVAVPESIMAMYDTIIKDIDGKNIKDRIRDHVNEGSLGLFTTLVDSEAHRVYCTAGEDTAEDVIRSLGLSGTKSWMTQMDDKVRDTHSYLQSKKVPIGEEFFTYDGDSALYPGGFKSAENNVNCRCFLIYSLS